jgi:hypothetical protein
MKQAIISCFEQNLVYTNIRALPAECLKSARKMRGLLGFIAPELQSSAPLFILSVQVSVFRLSKLSSGARQFKHKIMQSRTPHKNAFLTTRFARVHREYKEVRHVAFFCPEGVKTKSKI